jgi:hypothetical protein
MVKKIIIIILLIIPGIASAADWDNAAFVLSYENPVISKGDYTLKVVDFDGYGTVSLNLSRNGVFLGSALLKTDDTDWYYMDSGRIRLKGVNITDINAMPTFGSRYSPEAEIIFAIEKSPGDDASLAVSISTDKEEYLLDQEIIATVKIRNIGEGNAGDIRPGINSDGLLTQGELLSGFSLEDGAYKSWDIKLKFPATLLKGVYKISVNASWKNAHATGGFAESSKTVKVKMPLEVRKTTTSETKLGKPVHTSLSVENIQSRSMTVRLTDALPMFFSLNKSTVTDNKSDLNWEFVLAPHERKVLSYWMIPEEIGAHRVPEAHATWNLWGGYYTNSSESDNIIAVYRGVSYKEQESYKKQEFPPDEVVEVLSGEDFSGLLNESGYALKDIKVKNDTLNVFVFIPRGTRVLNATRITIKSAESPPVHSNLILAGDMYYQLEPEGATFNPHIIIDLPLNASNAGMPAIWRYSSIWSSLGSTVNGSRISARSTEFSIYGVFIETSPKVTLGATIRPVVSIEVTPDSLYFGKIAPGEASDKNNITVENRGASSVSVTANVTDDAGNLYVDGLYLDDEPFKKYVSIVLKNEAKLTSVALKVPETYEGVGRKNGTLVFWAEAIN